MRRPLLMAVKEDRVARLDCHFIRGVLPVSVMGLSGTVLPLTAARQVSFEPCMPASGRPTEFVSRTAGYPLMLSANEVVLELAKQMPAVLHMKLVNADPKAGAAGLEELTGKVNYFIGNDR